MENKEEVVKETEQVNKSIVNNQKPKKKKKRKLAKLCSILSNVFIIPIIILAFFCTILTFSAKANNRVPSIMGMSIVTVLTNSMEPDYKVGEVLVIKKCDVNKLKVGDNIAFYGPKIRGSMFVDEKDGVIYSRVIYHKIIRIIYVEDENTGNKIRYFVCRGVNPNLGKPDYKQVNEGEGDYVKVGEEYKLQEGGNYVMKLEDLVFEREEDINTGTIEDSKMSTMQYVTDDMVVGVYDKGISPAIGGFITFCGTSTGLLAMVIVPSIVLIIITIIGLTKEVKQEKEDDAREKEVLEGNIKKVKEKHKVNETENVKQPEKQEEVTVEDKKKNVANIIDSVIKTDKPKKESVSTPKTTTAKSPNGPVKTTTTTKTVTKTTTTTKVVEPVSVGEPKKEVKASQKTTQLKAGSKTSANSTTKTAGLDSEKKSATTKVVPKKAPPKKSE